MAEGEEMVEKGAILGSYQSLTTTNTSVVSAG